jgi:hypothetical protein
MPSHALVSSQQPPTPQRRLTLQTSSRTTSRTTTLTLLAALQLLLLCRAQVRAQRHVAPLRDGMGEAEAALMRRCQRDLVLRYLAAPALPGGQDALRHVGRIAGAAPGAAALRAVLAALAERTADPLMPAQLRSILGNANSESMLHSLVFQRIQQIIKLEALQEALLQCAPGRLHPVATERGVPREQQHPPAELVQAARYTDATPVPHLPRSIAAQEQLTKVHLRRAANEELHGSHFHGAVLKRRNSNEGETRTLVKKPSLSAFDPLKVSKPKPVEAPTPLAGVPPGAASITQHADTAQLKSAAWLATEKENLASEPALICFSPKRGHTKPPPTPCFIYSAPR